MFVFENLHETTTNLIGRRELVRLYHPTTTTDEMPFTDQSKIMTAVSATLCGSGLLGTFTGFFLTVCIHFLSCLFCACDGPLWVHGWGLLNDDDLCGSRKLIAIPSNIAIYFGRFVDEKKAVMPKLNTQSDGLGTGPRVSTRPSVQPVMCQPIVQKGARNDTNNHP